MSNLMTMKRFIYNKIKILRKRYIQMEIRFYLIFKKMLKINYDHTVINITHERLSLNARFALLQDKFFYSSFLLFFSFLFYFYFNSIFNFLE